MPPSDAVIARIHAKAAQLTRYYERITRCHVVVERSDAHRRSARMFHITLEISVPGADIVVRHQPALHGPLARIHMEHHRELERGVLHANLYLTIRDVFEAARRRLEDYARRQRHDVKWHTRCPVPASAGSP